MFLLIKCSWSFDGSLFSIICNLLQVLIILAHKSKVVFHVHQIDCDLLGKLQT